MNRIIGAETDAKTARDIKGRFGPGNPGKPVGARNKTTQAALALLEGEAEALTRKAVEMALGGDVVALRFCLERLVPVRRNSAIQFDLPDLSTSKNAPAAARAVLVALSDGRIAPTDAETALRVIEFWRQAQSGLEGQYEAERMLGDLLKF